MSLNIHFLSNAPWCATGYGNQTKVFLPRLQTLGHQISMTAFWGLEGSILIVGGVKIYPRGFHPYGLDIVAANAKHERADIIISLIDAWVLNPTQMQLGNNLWVPWFPIDSEPIAPLLRDMVKGAFKRIVFSHHAERMMNQVGLDYYYVPHGVETKVLEPKDRAESRERIGLPKDAYVVGMIAANKGNPSRKAFTEQIAAFKILKDAHPEAVLYLHTYDGVSGQNQCVNLVEFVNGMELVIGKDVYFVDQHQYKFSLSDDYMAHAYSALDVLMNVSLGEGFGIPIVEAQSCGTPVIVGDWTSMGELCFSGHKIDKRKAAPTYNALATYQFVARIEDIAEALLDEYDHPSSRDAARLGALEYDADLVTERYWKPTLEDIQANIADESTTQYTMNSGAL